MKRFILLAIAALFASFLFTAVPAHATTCSGLSKDRSTGERQSGTFGIILCIYTGDLARELLNWEGGGNSRDKSVQRRLQKDGTLSTDTRNITVGLRGISMEKDVTYTFFSNGKSIPIVFSSSTNSVNISVRGAGRLIVNIPRSILRPGWCVALKASRPLEYNDSSRCFTHVGELDSALLHGNRRWNWARIYVR